MNLLRWLIGERKPNVPAIKGDAGDDQVASAATAPRAIGIGEKIASLARDRGVLTGVIAGLVCYFVLQFSFGCYVHYYYGGDYSGPLLISTLFGITKPEAEAGIRPMCAKPGCGWDGQFYYHQANDVLIRGDAKYHNGDGKSLLNASYRYQRIGGAMLSYVAARLFGQSFVSPAIYFGTHIFLTSLGFGVLAGWLAGQGRWPGWALAWLLSFGGLHALIHGLPDSAADALFIVAACSMMSQRLWLYLLSSTLLVLTRENYAIFAAMVFGMTALNWVQWPAIGQRWLRTSAVALPGVVLIAWTAYVAVQTDTPFLGGSRNAAKIAATCEGHPSALLGAPFYAAACQLYDDVKMHRTDEIVIKLLCLTGMLLMLVLAIRNAHKSPLVLAAIPCMVLVTMTGWIVWLHWSGYGKVVSSMFIVGAFLIPYTGSILLRLTLAAAALLGTAGFYQYDIRHEVLRTPENGVEQSQSPQFDAQTTETVADARNKVTTTKQSSPGSDYRGLFSWCHRTQMIHDVKVANLSEAPWRCIPYGNYCICLGWIVKKEGGEIVSVGRSLLTKQVKPGETADFHVAIERPLSSGDYELQIGMIQEGQLWFPDKDPSSAFVEKFSVP